MRIRFLAVLATAALALVGSLTNGDMQRFRSVEAFHAFAADVHGFRVAMSTLEALPLPPALRRTRPCDDRQLCLRSDLPPNRLVRAFERLLHGHRVSVPGDDPLMGPSAPVRVEGRAAGRPVMAWAYWHLLPIRPGDRIPPGAARVHLRFGHDAYFKGSDVTIRPDEDPYG